MAQVKDRMEALGFTQVDMILALQKRGITVQPPEISCIIRGISTYPKARKILRECEVILNEYETQR